jgi:hypothetical protein
MPHSADPRGQETRKQLVAALASFGLLALALGVASAEEPRQQSSEPLQAGTRLIYDLSYSNASLADLSAIARGNDTSPSRPPANVAPKPQAFKTSLKAMLIVTVLRVNPEESLLAFSLRPIDLGIRYNDVEAATDAQRARNSLSRDFYAAVNSDGKIVRIEFTPEVDSTAQGFIRGILAGMQLLKPPANAPSSSWDVEEEDANGVCVVRYARVEESKAPAGTLVFNKKKLRYLPRIDSSSDRTVTLPLMIVPDGEMLLREDAATGHLVSVHTAEHLLISLSGRTLADSNSELAVNLTSSQVVRPSEIDQLSQERERLSAALKLTSLYEPQRDKGDAIRRRQEILGAATAESLLESLAAVETGASPEHAQAPLSEQLEALFLLRPESCRAFEPLLLKSPYGSSSFRLLIALLGRVGNTEAQTALRHGLRARVGERPAAILLMRALSSVGSPATDTEKTLRELAFGAGDPQIAQSAQLAFGSLARRLRNTEPQRASEIVREISDRIESSPAIEAKVRLLGALGNAGTPEAASILQRYLDDSHEDLRVAALAVLIRVQPDRADEFLTQHLLGDASESIRVASARELASRKATAATFDAQKQAFAKDAAVTVRVLLLGGLWQARENFPEGADLVRSAARQDTSEEVRQMAMKLLANSSPST